MFNHYADYACSEQEFGMPSIVVACAYMSASIPVCIAFSIINTENS